MTSAGTAPAQLKVPHLQSVPCTLPEKVCESVGELPAGLRRSG